MSLTQLLVSRMVRSCIYIVREIYICILVCIFMYMYIHGKSVLKCSDTNVIFTSISENKANPTSIGHTSAHCLLQKMGFEMFK